MSSTLPIFAKIPIRICFHLDAENGLCAYLYTESDHGWLSKSTNAQRLRLQSLLYTVLKA
jgi:hypothetical protein